MIIKNQGLQKMSLMKVEEAIEEMDKEIDFFNIQKTIIL